MPGNNIPVFIKGEHYRSLKSALQDWNIDTTSATRTSIRRRLREGQTVVFKGLWIIPADYVEVMRDDGRVYVRRDLDKLWQGGAA